MFFKGKDPNSLEQPLFNVLLAFAQVNTEVGYCQGLNYVAGLLLLVTKNEDTSFWLLKTLIEDILPDYYSSGLTGLLLDFKVLEKIMFQSKLRFLLKKLNLWIFSIISLTHSQCLSFVSVENNYIHKFQLPIIMKSIGNACLKS